MVGIAALAIAYLGWNAFAWFTGPASNSVALDAGNLSVAVGAHGPANRLSIAATHLVPGDQIFRAFTVTVDGSVGLSSITLTTEASTSSPLDTTPDALLMYVVSCDVPLDETMTAGIPTYQCPGVLNVIYAGGPGIAEDIEMTGLDLGPGATNYCAVMFEFAGDDDDSNLLQGLSSVIDVKLEGHQRAGEYK